MTLQGFIFSHPVSHTLVHLNEVVDAAPACQKVCAASEQATQRTAVNLLRYQHMQFGKDRNRPDGAEPWCVAKTFVGQQRLLVLAHDPPTQSVVMLTIPRTKSLGEHHDGRAGSLDAKAQDRREHAGDGAQRLDVKDGCAKIAVRSGDEA